MKKPGAMNAARRANPAPIRTLRNSTTRMNAAATAASSSRSMAMPFMVATGFSNVPSLR